jgi:hypothetical protein
MSTLLAELTIIPGAVGPALSTAGLDAQKTLIVSGVAGTINIEASSDGVEFCSIATFQSASEEDKIVDVVAAFMRVDASNGGANTACVVAEGSATMSGVIPSPPGNGPGAALDVSNFGPLTTIFVSGIPGGGSVGIEVSCDGVEFSSDFKTFTADGCDTKSIAARFIRATGSSAVVGVSAQNPNTVVGFDPQPISVYVYRPGATGDDAPGGNVYTDWEECWNALQATKHLGSRTLEFDGRFSGEVGPGNGKVARIPEGSWDMEGVQWTTVPRDGSVDSGFLAVETLVAWDDNAFCPNVDRMIGNYWHDGEVHSPLSSACVMGDAGFVTRLINTNVNAAPMLKLPDNLGFFIMFLDNRVQLTSTLSGDVVPAPLIDFGNNFGFVAGRGGEAKENAFANSGFLFFFMWPSLAGPHNWNFPAMSGFATQVPSRHGGYFMNTDIAVDGVDFTARVNQFRRIDSALGPVEVTFPQITGVTGDVITLEDVSGEAGTNFVSVVGPNTIEKPYLNSPFQAKTWVSQPGGTWLLQSESSEDFVTDVQTAAFTCVNNAINLAETDTLGASIVALLPLAADARKGAKIVLRNLSTGGGGFFVNPTPSGGDAIVGSVALADGDFATYQSDGGTQWIQVA